MTLEIQPVNVIPILLSCMVCETGVYGYMLETQNTDIVLSGIIPWIIY
jgi:hypothetical protein